jgi:hypothetical protein
MLPLHAAFEGGHRVAGQRHEQKERIHFFF